MPATISSIPSPALPVAQFAMSAADASDGASVSSSADTGQGAFAELFQKLTGKQLSADADAGATALPIDVMMAATTATDSAEAGDALVALLPFLEAMGLVKTETAPEEGHDTLLPGKGEDVDASPLAGIASALTPQLSAATAAISAGNGAQSGLPAPLAETQPQLALQTMNLTAENQADRQEISLINEFSAKLTTARESTGDKTVSIPTIASMVANPAGGTVQHTPVAAVPALPVAQHVGAAGWGQEVGNHVVWMANRMTSQAELVLTPPQMGRVEVSLSITGDQASVSFVSANAAVRDSLEAALPRLREVLNEAGIQLSQTQVGAENSRQSAQQEKNGDNFGFDRDNRTASGQHLAAVEAPPASAGLKIGHGLVDVFA